MEFDGKFFLRYRTKIETHHSCLLSQNMVVDSLKKTVLEGSAFLNFLLALNQGNRSYSPLQQPTTQQVMIDTISAGPTNVFLLGMHTNFALFLMKNPQLKKNVKHIYIMGGGVRSQNPTGCCPKNDTSCVPRQCGDHGNMFTTYTKNPHAEFNIYGDPFGVYQVI